ncbi:hypothetical protein [uncultured Kordia sp.]|uniref:hypothetical protein n=1 Tax=uncultured Kordia sp. TaxID=507699 RepID=UPI00262027D6|nr:hypothetical protein [uncultured Kordia sp.]
MKNIKNTVLALLLIAGIGSCSKEDATFLETESNILTKIADITSDFIDGQDETIVSAKAFDPTYYMVDITAGKEDYDQHHDYDHAVDTGIAASEKAAEKAIAPANGYGGNPVVAVVNPNNPLDYTGRFHAEILASAIYQNHQIVYPNGEFSYTNSINFSNNYMNITVQNMLSENEFNAFYEHVVNKIRANDNLLSKVMQQDLREGKLTQSEGQILIMYFQAQESSNTLNGYIQYSIQIENMVVNSNLPSSSKDLLLFVMATARHDINFWNPY